CDELGGRQPRAGGKILGTGNGTAVGSRFLAPPGFLVQSVVLRDDRELWVAGDEGSGLVAVLDVRSNHVVVRVVIAVLHVPDAAYIGHLARGLADDLIERIDGIQGVVAPGVDLADDVPDSVVLVRRREGEAGSVDDPLT